MKTILLIEDNQDMRENTAEILELADYHVITAKNGKAGIEEVKKQIPELIICDIMMPELDGYGVLHVLNKKPETASIPFIFLSAKAERGDVRKGMTQGADDYLTKPFDDTELLDAVESRLKKSEILKTRFQNNAEGLEKFFNEVRSLEALKELAEDRDIRAYKKRNLIYSEGQYPVQSFFIRTGKVKTYKINEDGKELILGLHGEGEFIGYLALLENSPYRESAMALEDTEISIIPKQDFLSLIFNNRDVSHRFIKMLSNDIVEKETQLLELAYSSVRQRVAGALLTLHKNYHNQEQNGIILSLSREDLAKIVGTAKETLIRTLADFKEEKLIEMRGNNLNILDAKRLSRIYESVY